MRGRVWECAWVVWGECVVRLVKGPRGGGVVQSDSPRLPRRQHRGGTPLLTSGEASERLQLRDGAERVVRSIVAAPIASPAPVMIGGRHPS